MEMSSPMRRVEEIKELEMNKILGSFNSMPKQSVSWKGHTWNLIKDSLNSFIRSIKTRHWISGVQYRNDKLSASLKLLSTTIIAKLEDTIGESKLEIQLKSSEQAIDVYSFHQANYLLTLAVKTHAMKINEILEKIDTTRFNVENINYLNKIKATVRGLNDSCQRDLKAETDFINRAQEKKLNEFNKTEEMENLQDKLHEGVKTLHEASSNSIDPSSSDEENKSLLIETDVDQLNNSGVDVLIVQTDFINQAQEKKLNDSNREEEMKILQGKLHEELKALQEALSNYTNPLSSKEEDRSSLIARDSLDRLIASINTGIETEELREESKKAIKLTEGFLKETSISSEEIKNLLAKLKGTHEGYANLLKKD
ncbi:Uncharacterized protein NEOC65_000545 [Neochlamydia sp. AcF65]|nr:Uncharacterized protein [Neochlamydia sp. AcF65]